MQPLPDGQQAQVGFSMAQPERAAFASSFWGLGLVAILLGVAVGGFLAWNRCRRFQRLRPCGVSHISVSWWAELLVRTAVAVTVCLFFAW